MQCLMIQKKMESRKGFNLVILKWLIVAAAPFLPAAIGLRTRSVSSEFGPLIRFLRVVDPQNVLGLGLGRSWRNPCLDEWKGLKCDLEASAVVEIRLEKSNLSGVINADALCKLPSLQVLDLAENRIRGTIPNSMLGCRKLRYLNLSSNLLSGRVPGGLTRLKNLRKLDISKNKFEGVIPNSKGEFAHLNMFSMIKGRALQSSTMDGQESTGETNLATGRSSGDDSKNGWSQQWIIIWLLLVLAFGLCLLIGYLVGKKAAKLSKEKAILKALQESPSKTPLTKTQEEEVKAEKKLPELVFFVGEEERFKLEDLLEATADLTSQSVCSTLYKVALKNNGTYAVKRMKKLQIPFEEFKQIMRQIGHVKHPNILPLVAYSYTPEEILLIYKYQEKGSVLNLFEDYIEDKKDFQWRLRLSVAEGIAKGLSFIYQNPNEKEIIPHGNLKLSNILLDENDEPLVSEFGYSRFLDPKRTGLCATKGYTPPERGLTEKGDVYSFGVILLELLTGKVVEKTGLDLPKWVNAMVREEWTGEVFDKELVQHAAQWAFPLLNIALKCVSNFPENRPTMAEVFEKIEDVIYAEQAHGMTPLSSNNGCHQDCCLLHSIIPETWDTPGSNY